ncbi:MAG: hypothetical protein ACHQ51_13295 [Elusimicrobiota bacterium]
MSAAESAGTAVGNRLLQLAGMIFAGLLAGTVMALGVNAYWLKPQRESAQLRYETMIDITKLFTLQENYFKAKGVYADGLDTLLTIAPDRDEIKARLARHVDMATLAVVGGPKKFKVEANALDADRTLVKLKGPVEQIVRNDTDVRITEASSSAGGTYGKPVAPAAPAAKPAKPRSR